MQSMVYWEALLHAWVEGLAVTGVGGGEVCSP